VFLAIAKVGPFKSIETPQEVQIERRVTVLVGMNESGKTVFLQALHKSDDVLGLAKFSFIDDFPRKGLADYEARHDSTPETATVLTYELDEKDIAELNQLYQAGLQGGFRFSVSHDYQNNARLMLPPLDERPVLSTLAQAEGLSPEYRGALGLVSSLRAVPEAAASLALNDADLKHLSAIKARLGAAGREAVLETEVAKWLLARTPKFHYFGDYEILPSKINLTDLAQRHRQNPAGLTAPDRGILALLRLANIRLEAFENPGNLEALVARMEAVSIRLTDQIMEFWKQNEDLEVRIDIRPNPSDAPPFNNGPNLYLRIANKRHRGVTTPFEQRSKGFIWFFSFLVWFDSVQQQLAGGGRERPLILLLDEPGLSLHALAQNDFLRYIDGLGERHQVLYTTHSPFMVYADQLDKVRVVEDRPGAGTVIADNGGWTDDRTVFPLQAALGWSIAQNLFVGERTLLVDGPADLVYLQTLSDILEGAGRVGLRSDITIVPVGGLDKVITFIGLLGANQLKLAVLHDYRGSPDQRMLETIRQKLIAPQGVLDASQFRDLGALGKSGRPTDVEDLLSPNLYLTYFNAAFGKQLAGVEIKEAALPPGDRIVERLEQYIASRGLQLRASGGFNHYLPALVFGRNPPPLDALTAARFEALFKAVNALF